MRTIRLTSNNNILDINNHKLLISNNVDNNLLVIINVENEIEFNQFHYILLEYYHFIINLIKDPLMNVTVRIIEFSSSSDIMSSSDSSDTQNTIPHDKTHEITGNDKITLKNEIRIKHKNVVLGGTFDHLHCGHKILLTMACSITATNLIIGVTNFTGDKLLKKKYHNLIEHLEIRISKVREFIKLIKPSLNVNVVAIDDDYGPTLTMPDLDAIVGSTETEVGCNMGKFVLNSVNQKRVEKGFSVLRVYLVDCLSMDSSKSIKDKISSSAIREYIHNNSNTK